MRTKVGNSTQEGSAMNIDTVFNRLCALAAMPAGVRSPLLASDRVDQNNLYAIQNTLSNLLIDVATAVGPKAQAHLAKRFPYAFESKAVPVLTPQPPNGGVGA
jgi:hypothetical protein